MRRVNRPPACIRARVVTIGLKWKNEGDVWPRKYKTVCPSSWTKKQFLDYCRAVHPEEVVTIIDWPDALKQHTWMVNPAAFSDFRNGLMK